MTLDCIVVFESVNSRGYVTQGVPIEESQVFNSLYPNVCCALFAFI